MEKSAEFYCSLLGFEKVADDPGKKGGQVLFATECEILLLPFAKDSLPNPVHFAFEVSSVLEFFGLLSKAEEFGLAPRSEPARDSRRGAGEFSRTGRTFRNFYVSDPAGSNVEVLVYIDNHIPFPTE